MLGMAQPAPELDQRPPHGVATGFLLLYLFLLMSRGVEILGIIVNLRLTLILMIVCILAAILTGGLLQSARTPIVLMFTFLTCWFMLATLTSQWRGGSVKILLAYWITSFACSLLVPSLISTLDQCRKLCYVLGFSLLPILLATVLFQSQIQGRDSTLYGTLGNPNDLAFSLLLLIPFAVFVMQGESWVSWKTIVCGLAIVFSIIRTLRTGSRAAVFSIAACLVLLFLSGGLKTKLKVLAATALMAAIALAFVSDSTLRRYSTVFSGTSYEEGMSVDEFSAIESTRARKMLFEESIRIMFEHPLFGVGPGIFSASLAEEQAKRGERQTWHEAHNSFTQLGSEAGIPALCIYLGIVIYSLKRTVSTYLLTRNDPNRILICRMAGTLVMALLVFTICATFGTYSYTFHLPVLAGLVQAFDVSARREMSKTQAVAPLGLETRLALPSLTTQALTTQALAPQASNYVRNRRLRNSRP